MRRIFLCKKSGSAREIQFGDELCIETVEKDRKNWVKAQPCVGQVCVE